MRNSYQPSTKAGYPSVILSFRWKRIFLWAAVICIVTITVKFFIALSLSMGYGEIYGSNMLQNAALVRRIAQGVAAAFLYWRFAAKIPSHRLFHVIVLFVVVQLFDILSSLLIGDSVRSWFSRWSVFRRLLAAAIGLAAASMGSNNSFKPKPPRGLA
jgi:hypothetical protein